MSTKVSEIMPAAETLTDSYLLNFPNKAAYRLAALPLADAIDLLSGQPFHVIAGLFRFLPPGAADEIIATVDKPFVIKLVELLPSQVTASLLKRQPLPRRNELLDWLTSDSPRISEELKELMSYPENTVGHLMDPMVQAVVSGITLAETINQLKQRNLRAVDNLFVVDDNMQVIAEVDTNKLLLADKNQRIDDLARPVALVLSALDPKEDVLDSIGTLGAKAIPVVDANSRLIGLVSANNVYQQTKEELVSDIQMMVGASKEERALSTSFFAVKKRLPWLQINLLTAFMAAAVVGAFEGLIAQFTALAILLPVAAGQSGNAGAQALAVTMRGLTLREITTRDWYKVLTKESLTGLINGVFIAITCALGVLVWSRSVGLALVMALAMVLSLTIACAAGALVPMLLKKLGQDPAQSSSIVLTTVTDIAGFMSFLGIATALSSMLS